MKAAQLRQAILQAAVQGKLVPQNSQDEPASDLLAHIQTEKAQLLKQGEIKKEKPLPPIEEDEPPFALPSGWSWCRLGELVSKVGSGSTPTGGKNAYSPTGIKFLRSQNVYNSGLVLQNVAFISDSLHKKMRGSEVKAHDILLNITGASIGRSCIIPEGFDTANVNQHVCIIRLINYNLINFIHLLLISPVLQQTIMNTQVGVSREGLSAEKIKHFLIPLPPLAEQHRIVAKANLFMSMCDELEAAEKELDSLEANLAEYLPKSILQAAVRGTLVPQNIHDEPASELLKRIQEEKSRLIEAGKLKKEKPLPPISEEENPFDLPDGWEWCRLGEVCLINPRNQLPDDREVSFIPMALISNSYFGGHHQEIRVWGKVKSGFTHFAENDIVLAKITPCFQNGKSCIVKNLKNGFGAGTTELHVLRCLQISPKYLLNFLKNPEFLRDGEKNMTGTAGQQRVPTDYIKNILFPLPPLAEQQRIVAKVDELMTLCEQLKNINPDSSLPLTDIQKTLPSLEISTPPEPKEQQYAIAARGDISTTETKEHRQAIEDLFGDGADG